MGSKYNIFKTLLNQWVPKAVILLYHKVIDLDYDPFSLAVSPVNFEEQMMCLKNNYNVISLDDLVNCLKKGKVPNQSIVITFDDGYVDNYIFAKPILEKLEISATFFITTSFIGTSECFWWERLESIFQSITTYPVSFAIEESNKKHIFEVLSEESQQKIFKSMQRLLRTLSPSDIYSYIAIFEQQLKLPEKECSKNRIMNENEIKEMSKGQFQIGAHTRWHSSLSSQTKEFQKEEILESKKTIENILSSPVVHFSYPYGTPKDYDAQTINIVKECGLESSCSTVSTVTMRNSNLYELPRVSVENLDQTSFKKFLKNVFAYPDKQ